MAVCAWPSASPSDTLCADIRQEDLDHTLYHKLMTAVGWQKNAAVTALAAEWLDRVEAMVGAPCATTRAMFASDT